MLRAAVGVIVVSDSMTASGRRAEASVMNCRLFYRLSHRYLGTALPVQWTASKLGPSKSRELQRECFAGSMVTVVGRSRTRMTAISTTPLSSGLTVEAVYKMLPTPSTARLRYLCGFEFYVSFTKSFLDSSAPSRK